jgi:hypothetical protein
MPLILFADNFLAGSLLSLLLPTGLLVVIAVWYVRTIRRVPEDTPESAPALPSTDVLAAGVEAGIESARPEPPVGES